MMGYRRTGHLQHGGDVDHALLTVAQQPKDADSGGVPQLSEHLRHGLEPLHPDQLLLDQGGLSPLSMLVGQFDVGHTCRSFLRGFSPERKFVSPIWQGILPD